MSIKRILCWLVLAVAIFSLTGCGSSPADLNNGSDNENVTSDDKTPNTNNNTSRDQTPNNNTSGDQAPNNNTDTGTDTTDDADVNSAGGDNLTYTVTSGHAIAVSSGNPVYTNLKVYKTGDASTSSYFGMSANNDDYDWKGTNAAIIARGGATITISGDSIISTDGSYANAVFSYGGNLNGSNSGDGTTVKIYNATITTLSNNSGGLMTTGGGVMEAEDLTITTSGGSSAAIRSDKGGGAVNVTGGTYTTNGQGSPAVYSTAKITVDAADLISNKAQGVVIEGGNSVTITASNINANHNTLNGQDSTHQAILIYQSMSGDASDGSSSFSMTDGSIINAEGDIFCVTNTTCTISLEGVEITNNDSSGNFLRAAAQNWGSSGSNGGNVTLNANEQVITGNILVDSSSSLTMNLTSSSFSGAINPSSQSGTVNVTLDSASTWTLTGNSYVTSLTNNGGTIEKGSYNLYVNGTAY